MRPELKKATRNLVVAEAGKHMTTRGIAQIEMKLGNEIFTWPMYVAPIGDSVLLGCDLIDEKDITINCKRGLQLNGEWIECQTTRQIDGIARVRIKEAITIPANSEIIIAGEGYDTEGLSSRYSILEPVVEDSRKIMVASTHADMCEYIGNITSASYKGNQTDKVDVQMLPELLQHATEDNLSVTDENVPVTEEIVNVIVTEEDGNMFCQEEKISQLKEGLHKTDLNQTKKELENEKHVTQDTRKDWRKRKKRAVEDTEGERTQDTQTDQKRRTNNTHYCLSLGGHLARIESETEKNLIRDELKHLSGHYWLDGIDDVIESDWRWASTYGKIEPTFWFPNEPSDTAANEDCMETHNDFRGLWNDLDCSSHLFSICEKEFLE
ncbi:unnamed protein product [Mytilus edulis]|uniref:C-type lectin domain-containing protein n=1 Tax=Mytilus edulis TaxID=6550 RepID=A0A8S3QIL1_MYTED|nr:unnamed protein product [Mytilus edulis]